MPDSLSQCLDHNLNVIGELPSCPVWTHFAQIAAIPRPSFHEKLILAYLENFADARSLKRTCDETGNLCIFRPGSGNGAQAPPVLIQGHVDMVTEKNSDLDFDFKTQGIRLEVKGEWLRSQQATTLGSDNGIGVAAALALLDAPDTANLPPIEALFTVAEEVGLQGAFALDAKALKLTAKTMLNLDTEDWGCLFVGCAGGGDTKAKLPVSKTAVPANARAVEIAVTGLRGGHSGVNIHEYRANANRLMMRALRRASQKTAVRLVSIDGGDKRNAIPRECVAMLAVTSDEEEQVLRQAIGDVTALFRSEFSSVEPNLSLEVTAKGVDTSSTQCLTDDSLVALMTIALGLPDGPVKFSADIPELVETSSNVAIVKMGESESEVSIGCSTRSSIEESLEDVRASMKMIVNAAGGSVDQPDAYPGWAPNMSSAVLQLAREEMAGVVPDIAIATKVPVKAIHAGLECGILNTKMGGGVDMVSYGPTITGAHSPDEQCLISTVPPFWDLTERILGRLATV